MLLIKQNYGGAKKNETLQKKTQLSKVEGNKGIGIQFLQKKIKIEIIFFGTDTCSIF